jgi:hypothetical protein
MFVCSTSRYVKVYRLDQPNPRKKVPASIENFYVEVGVPDPALEYKTYFDGAGENETAIKLLRRKYVALFHTLEAERQNGNLAECFIGDLKRQALKLLEVRHPRCDEHELMSVPLWGAPREGRWKNHQRSLLTLQTLP